MPRIAQVISEVGPPAGAAAMVLALSRAAEERGWDHVVLNPFAAGDRALAEYFEGMPYEALAPHRARALPRNRRWLRSRLRAHRADIVHVHLLHAMFTVATLPRIPGDVRVLTHHHSRYLLEHGRPLAARLERLAARRYDRVIAPSGSVRDFLIGCYGLDNVLCIPNGWSGEPAEPAPAERPTIVCVANFRPVKRHEILLSAFARVREGMPDARLELLGDGPRLGDVRDLAAELGIAEAVEFRGSVGVWPRLARAQVFALASANEGSPVAVLEAMAAGLPVVAFNVAGVRDVVEDGATGYLAPSGDAEALAERLLELLRDPAARGRMGAAGRRAAEGLTVDAMSERYFELFEELTAKAAGDG